MTLDQIRADIIAERDRAIRVVEREQRVVDCKIAELEAHDRAVAAMEPTAGRRNIAALVLAELTAAPQTVEQIAQGIDAQPRQVKDALARLGADKAEETSLGWVRVGGLAL